MPKKPIVAIVMGSDSDYPVMKESSKAMEVPVTSMKCVLDFMTSCLYCGNRSHLGRYD